MVGLVIYVLVGFIYGVMLDLIGHSWDALKATLPKVSSCVFEFTMLLISIICWPVMVLFTIVLIVETVVNSVKARRKAERELREVMETFNEMCRKAQEEGHVISMEELEELAKKGSNG